MEWLQQLLDTESAPALVALLLGLLTAISPCPLATNIAAIGYIGKEIDNRRIVFYRGVLYTLGRVAAYTILGIVLITILKGGASVFGIQKFVSKWGELFLSPLLMLMGLFMLFGHKLPMPSFGFSGNGEPVAKRGGWGAMLLGMLFALAFCPSSAVFYFGMLIPMSVNASAGYLLPIVYAIATALPVLIVAWILAFSVQSLGSFYGKMQAVQRWLNLIVGYIFISVGIYYCVIMYF